MSNARRFVKSAGTDTPVNNSVAALEKMLQRYGASGFGVQRDYQAMTATVNFRVPDDGPDDTVQVPVQLVVSTTTVARALYGDRNWTQRELAQAERVAWRQLVLWVDAACSAAAAGVQRMSDAFFAHALVTAPDGSTRRLTAHLDEAAGGNWRQQLLPGPRA